MHGANALAGSLLLRCSNASCTQLPRPLLLQQGIKEQIVEMTKRAKAVAAAEARNPASGHEAR